MLLSTAGWPDGRAVSSPGVSRQYWRTVRLSAGSPGSQAKHSRPWLRTVRWAHSMNPAGSAMCTSSEPMWIAGQRSAGISRQNSAMHSSSTRIPSGEAIAKPKVASK